jgi:hypothetical protein
MAEIDPLAFQKGYQASQSIFDNASKNRLAELALRQKEQEIAEAQATGNALSAFYQRGDTPDSRQQLYGQLPGTKILATQQSLAAADKTRQEQQKQQRDQLIAQFDWADKNMAGVQDQAGWDAFRQRAATVYPDIAAKLPEQFDPASIQASRARMIPVLEQWKEENAQNRFNAQQDTTRRGQDLSAQTAARGQDITLRGQDLSADTTRRGQDLTNARAVEANAAKAAADKAPTEFQSKAALFGARAEEADKILSSVDYSPAALSAKQAVSNVPLVGGALGAAANVVTSNNNQRAEQAQRDFINAILRLESGAVIGKEEFENARKQYFPQPGDSAEVIAQKAANRRTAIEGLKRGAGKAAYSAPGSKPKPSLSDIFGN